MTEAETRGKMVVGQQHQTDFFASSDLEECRFYLAKLFKPHELNISGCNEVIDAKTKCTEFEGLSFIDLSHGATVDIDPEKLDDFFNLQIPVRGSGHVRIDNSHLDISPLNAFMISPTLGVKMHFERNCEHIILKIRRSAFEGFLERQLQSELVKPLVFKPGIDVTFPKNAQLVDFIVSIGKQVSVENSPLTHKMIRDRVTSLLMSTILVTLDHNYKSELESNCHTAVPYYIKRARDYIHQNAKESISITSIAEESSISVRSIYLGFRKYYGMTPMEYLKKLRLSLVNQKLRDLTPAQTSVTMVALEYGFYHFGNFSAAYKKKYGELPSETLKNSAIHV